MDYAHINRLSTVETIIVGVDLSEDSKALVKEAQWLSKKWGARLVLVNVRPMEPYVEGGYASMDLWDEDRDRARWEVRQFYETDELHGVEIEVVYGDAANEINSLSRKYANPLVLVGHSHKNRLERLLAGSASRKLAGQSEVPLLIV